MEHVRVEREERVAIVTIVDEARRNAMTIPMVDEIVATFDELESDEAVGAVVVTGHPPAFCSGADLSSLATLAGARDSTERASIASVYEGFLRVRRSPLPTVAAVNGPAVGAGLNLALAADVRVAARSARFDPRFLRIGLHPGGGHTWMLDRLVGPQTAAAMILFGQAVDGQESVARGLAWSCVPDDELLGTAVALAGRAASVPRPLSARAKATLAAAARHGELEPALAGEVADQTWSLSQGWFRPVRPD